MKLPVLGPTGSWREWAVATVVSLIAVAGMLGAAWSAGAGLLSPAL